jgi:hypothetical protein
MAQPKAKNNYNVVDMVLHGKNADNEDIIVLPTTRYENIMGRIEVVTDMSKYGGGSLFFYKKDSVDVSKPVLQTMIGNIFNSD